MSRSWNSSLCPILPANLTKKFHVKRDLCAAMFSLPDQSGCNEAMGSPSP
jgi:hypothetical protein